MGKVRIALANIGRAATAAESVVRAEAWIAHAGEARAALICFPECYVPGYRWPGREQAAPDADFLQRAWTRVAEAAARSGVAVVLGTERIVENRPRIAVLVVDRDGWMQGFQDKVQLDPSEEAMFVPGAGRRVFEAGGMKFGVAICHEGFRYPETVRQAARAGAQVVFHPHYAEPEEGGARPTSYAEPANSFHEKAALCRAAENTIYYATVNCAIEGSPTTSAVVRPDGTLQCWQPYGREGLLIADLDLSLATGLLAARCRS